MIAIAYAWLSGCSSKISDDQFFGPDGGGTFGAVGDSAISISPITYAFGPTRTFTTTTAPVTFTLSNSVTVPLFIESLGIPSNPNFSVQGTTCNLGKSVALQPGSKCTVSVAFNPVSVGSLNWGLVVKYAGDGTSDYTTVAAVTGVGATNVVFPGVSLVDTVRARSAIAHWTNVANQNGYACFVVNGTALQLIATVPKDSTSCVISGLLPSTNYKIRVRAFDFFAALDTNTVDYTITTTPDPVLTPIPTYTYAANNPLVTTTALSYDINNTVTGNDVTMNYTCAYDTLIDGSVTAGANCSLIPGFTLSAGFAGTAGVIDGNGQFAWTPPVTLAGQNFEILFSGTDGSVTVSRFLQANVRAPFKYDGTMLAAYQSYVATQGNPGTTSPFTSIWQNIAPSGIVNDLSLASGSFATGWIGNGTSVSNPYRLSFAGVTGATADRAIGTTSLNAQPNLMFTSWLRPTNVSLGSVGYVFGNRGPGLQGWSVNQRADGTYNLAVGSTAPTSYPSAVLGFSPSVYFKFDDAAGATAFETVSGSSVAIQNPGQVNFSQAGAYPGSTAFQFTGNSVINLPAPIAIPAGTWTVSAWLKTPLPADGNWKTAVRGTASDYTMIFNFNTTEFGTYLSNNGGFHGSGTIANSLSVGWHHFAEVGTGTTIRFFVDGAYVNSFTGGSSTDPFNYVGSSPGGGQPIAFIDDLALFATQLTDAQVNQIYLGGCAVALVQNQWAQIGGLFDGVKASLFNNGSKVCDYTPTGSIRASPESFTVGAQSTGAQAWPGELANLYVYSGGAAADINANYVAEANQFTYPKSCNAWLSLGFTASGNYTVDLDGVGPLAPMSATCDMTTDGGGWMLVLNYLHQANTNPNSTPRPNSLPLQGSSALGVDESANATFFGHASPSLMNSITYSTTRFYCITSDHARVVDFKNTSASCKTYFQTGTTGSCSDIATTSTLLPNNTANLPFSANSAFSAEGDIAATDFPFYASGANHWGIQGLGNRWECDDFPNGPGFNTLHRIWVR